MRIKLYTLVDITETGARRTDNNKQYRQQCNYNTVIQTIGLRANLEPKYCRFRVDDVKTLKFGKSFSGKQRFWEFCFEIEFEEAVTEEMLMNDFDLVPVVVDLDETVHIQNKVFRTKCANDCNISFVFE